MSWKPEVTVGKSDPWVSNALRFATKEEAENNARDLAARWFAVYEWRAVESTDPVNYSYLDGVLQEVKP